MFWVRCRCDPAARRSQDRPLTVLASAHQARDDHGRAVDLGRQALALHVTRALLVVPPVVEIIGYVRRGYSVTLPPGGVEEPRRQWLVSDRG